MSNEEETFKNLPAEEQLRELCDWIRGNLVGNPVVTPDAVCLWLRDYMVGSNMFFEEKLEEIKELKKRVSELEAKLPQETQQVEVTVLSTKTTEP